MENNQLNNTTMNLLDELIKTARKQMPTHGSNYLLDILITTRERLQKEELTKDNPLPEHLTDTLENFNKYSKKDVSELCKQAFGAGVKWNANTDVVMGTKKAADAWVKKNIK